jgi:hypothetical protein
MDFSSRWGILSNILYELPQSNLDAKEGEGTG